MRSHGHSDSCENCCWKKRVTATNTAIITGQMGDEGAKGGATTCTPPAAQLHSTQHTSNTRPGWTGTKYSSTRDQNGCRVLNTVLVQPEPHGNRPSPLKKPYYALSHRTYRLPVRPACLGGQQDCYTVQMPERGSASKSPNWQAHDSGRPARIMHPIATTRPRRATSDRYTWPHRDVTRT
jgi:hypothetical protein